MTLEELSGFCRYSDDLSILLDKLKAKELLYFKGENGWQGDLDVDVLLNDGRVFSYHYYYGSCSGCDDWDDRNLTSEQITEEMQKEATFFENIDSYNKWAEAARRTAED